MKCPKCSTTFKYLDVPNEDRVVNSFATSFKCPKCRVLLKPDQRFKIGSNLSLFLLAIGSFGFMFKVWLNIGLNYETSGFFGLAGVLLFYVNLKNIRLLSDK